MNSSGRTIYDRNLRTIYDSIFLLFRCIIQFFTLYKLSAKRRKKRKGEEEKKENKQTLNQINFETITNVNLLIFLQRNNIFPFSSVLSFYDKFEHLLLYSDKNIADEWRTINHR